MLIHNYLENSATQHPNKIAVIHDDTRATYKELNEQSTSLAQYLKINGVVKGDRIEAIYTWRKEGWFVETVREYWFKGSLQP